MRTLNSSKYKVFAEMNIRFGGAKGSSEKGVVMPFLPSKYFVEMLCHMKIVKVKVSVSFRFSNKFCAVKLKYTLWQNFPLLLSFSSSGFNRVKETFCTWSLPLWHISCICELLQNSCIVQYGLLLLKIQNIQNV